MDEVIEQLKKLGFNSGSNIAKLGIMEIARKWGVLPDKPTKKKVEAESDIDIGKRVCQAVGGKVNEHGSCEYLAYELDFTGKDVDVREMVMPLSHLTEDYTDRQYKPSKALIMDILEKKKANQETK